MTRMPHASVLLALFAAALVSVTAPRPALARSEYLVHVDIAGQDKSLNVALPWTRNHGGSPFDFTDDHDSDVSLERLRWAWTTLRRLPEGEAVTITRRGEVTRLTRERGFLAIEKQHSRERDHDHGRVLVPDYIVETVLRNDGRLGSDDIESLLERRGRVVLVKVEGDEGGVNVWIGRNDD